MNRTADVNPFQLTPVQLHAEYQRVGKLLKVVEQMFGGVDSAELARLQAQEMDIVDAAFAMGLPPDVLVSAHALATVDAAQFAPAESSNIQHANGIAVGVCDSCPAVHVNLTNNAGDVFATANVPIQVGDQFIARFKACMDEVQTRAPAGSRTQ